MIKLGKKYDVIIVGTGVAGLNCAINLPEDKSILIICKDAPAISDSYLAQGGICCLRDDSDFEDYFNDTMRAGHYENDEESVECMIKGSREIIDDLISVGVDFEREEDGSLAYTREGGHGKNRILFHEDCTGKEITTCLMKKARSKKNILIVPYMTMLDLIAENNQCYGIVAKDTKNGRLLKILADYTVLATGGIGGIYENSTNFRILTGDALAIAINHGVEIKSINYVQVHPTTLYSKKKGRRFLISESVRGEGAILLDKNFARFCDELQPRDIVTKEILKQMEKDKTNHVWLDMRTIERQEVLSHFPTIVQRCLDEGYDVFRECIPVVPSQHYFMGGIKSSTKGKTSMQRLYAVGETCCNGVHGKNRLASNSLLESLVFAKRAAQDIKSSYCPNNMAQALQAKRKINSQKYRNINTILKAYKQTVLNAIKEANENE
ncbi:MAG: L-aspartate oxidase [Clostridiales bacterium]|nr:L-aspartate oxidase [Clostridiales bacterium]